MEFISKHAVDFSELCRVCAHKEKNFMSIFHTKRKGKTMADMLSSCLQKKIQENDGRPSNICFRCMPQLVKTFELLSMVKKSEQFFEKMILLSISGQTNETVDEVEPLVTTEYVESTDDPLNGSDMKYDGIELMKNTKARNIRAKDCLDDDRNKNIQQKAPKKNESLFYTAKILEPTNTNNIRVNRKPPKGNANCFKRSTKVYECYICNETSVLLRDLQAHLRKHDNRSSTRCCVCGDPNGHDSHLCRDNQIACEYCPEICSSTTEILHHLNVHKNNFLFYKCFRCATSFNMKILRDWHDMQHDRFQFDCQICAKRFPTKRTLRNHTRFVHSDERPYLCAECGKGFKNKCTLKKHAIVHTGQKPFACSECPKSFARKGALSVHMTIHREEKHVCLICGTIMKSFTSLRTHLWKTHSERKKKCTICDFKCHTNDRLAVHMRIHTGEKPYHCSYCTMAYAQKNDLVKHLRTHIGQNTYICDNCHTSFRYYAELKKHNLYTCSVNQLITDDKEISSTSTSILPSKLECN